MIIKAGDPGTQKMRVIDTVTGEDLRFCTQVDTETGEAWCWALNVDGLVVVKDGEAVTEKCPNPVRIEVKP